MRRDRRTAVSRIAVGLAVLALTACSGEPTPEPTAPQTHPSEDLTSTGWRTADRDDVQDGGTLTLPVEALPAVYPGDPSSPDADERLVASLSVPAFVRIGADGAWAPDPDYLDSLEVTDEDPLVVEMRINPKARWSDGTAMTWRDVAATRTALLDQVPADTIAVGASWRDVASVAPGDDERHVVMTFTQAEPDWPVLLRAIHAVGPETSSGEGAAATPDATALAVSGGPFRLTQADGAEAVFVRNAGWWGDEPRLDSVVFRVTARDAVGEAFGRRAVDVVDVRDDADVLAAVEQRNDAVVQRSLSTVVRQVVLNGVTGAFADPAVRRAFAVALDRPALGDAILGTVSAPVQLAGSLVFAPGQRGYTDHLSGELTGNPDDARAILTDAGYTIGADGVGAKGGRRLHVRFVVPDDAPESSTIGQLVRQQTAPAGFEVEVVTVPADEYSVSYVSAEHRDFEATTTSWQGSVFPLVAARAAYWPAGARGNLGGVTDPTLSDLFAQAADELDPDARLELADQIDGVVTHLFTTVPLFVEPMTWGVRADLANYGPAQLEAPRWQDVGFTA